MSSTGRKRKQQLRPRQDVHRSPVKRQSLDTKTEPLLVSSYPLADYDCVDIKPDLTELQLQLAVNKQKEGGTGITSATTNQDDIKCELELELQQSDSDEDGYSEINITPREVFCEDEDDEYDAEWTVHQASPRLIFKFNTPTQQTGLKSVRKFACPLYYFNTLLGARSEFFGQLARGCNARNMTLHASGEELETFLGLCLLLSDVKLAELSDYWSDQTFHGFVGFAQKMPLHRFLELLQSLSFDELDPNVGSAHNAGGDAGKLVNFFNVRMAELYVCGQPLVLNDPIIQWKGKFSFQNELPQRHRCNAVMLHLLSEQSGLIVRILPEIVDQQQLARNSRQLVVQRTELALQLLQEHLHRGHSVYACKYYGSYGLAHVLSMRRTYCSGLLDRNRYGNSKALVHQQLTPNSIATRYATPLMMAKWRRREKCVYFYSSDCLAIYAKEMSMQKINARPKLIQQLDFHLRSTQSTRQQLISYQPSCSGMQRQQQLIVYLLNMLVFNAHLLYLTNAQSTRGFPNTDVKLKTYAEFRVAIIKSLLKEDVVPAAVGVAVAPTQQPEPVTPVTTISKRQDPKTRQSTSGGIRPIPESKLMEPKHELITIQQDKTAKPLRKNCQHCNKVGMLQFTKYMCNLCPNNPGLCQDPCFKLWHERLKDENISNQLSI